MKSEEIESEEMESDVDFSFQEMMDDVSTQSDYGEENLAKLRTKYEDKVRGVRSRYHGSNYWTSLIDSITAGLRGDARAA